MKILIINGYPQSGKDTFCEFAKKNNQRVYTYSTVDKIKELALLIGWNGEKDWKGRRLLSDLKDALSRYNDLPYKETMSFIRETMDKCAEEYGEDASDTIFLIHSREPEDIERFCRNCGARSIFLSRRDSDKQWSNHADNKVKEWNYDYYIDNDGDLEELNQFTCDFIKAIRGERWNSYIRKEKVRNI